MKSFLLLLLTCGFLLGCKSPKNTASSITRIVHGTSYGHCVGYCMSEELYEGNAIKFRKMSRQEDTNPEKNESAALSTEDFNTLANSFDFSKFKALPERIGCPDCADGGAEYIEITTGTETKRVEFEANRDPEGMEKLLKILRKNREGHFPE